MKQTLALVVMLTTIGVPLAARADAPKQPDGLPKELLTSFKVWAGHCSQCHNAERVYGTKYTNPKQIEQLVSRMARKTTTISRDDQKLIVAYITWHNKPRK